MGNPRLIHNDSIDRVMEPLKARLDSIEISLHPVDRTVRGFVWHAGVGVASQGNGDWKFVPPLDRWAGSALALTHTPSMRCCGLGQC